MMGGSFPWSLDVADVWRMICDGFNEDEIAHVGGLTRFQARNLIAKALRAFSKNIPDVITGRRTLPGVAVISW